MSTQENEEPTEFSFQTRLTREDLLELAESNSDIDKQCYWLPNQALSNGVDFKKDGKWKGLKFGKDFLFDTFWDFLIWSASWEEIEKAISESSLFGIAIIVGLNDKNIEQWEGGAENKYFAETTEPATEIRAFYPITGRSGYWIQSWDEDRNPKVYKIQITRRDYEIEPTMAVKNATVIFYVHASRVVRFPAIQKNLSLPGTPKSMMIAHMAKAKQIYYESVVNGIKNMSAGTYIRRVANEDEALKLEAIDSTPSYKNRLYIIGGVGEPIDSKVQIYVPDFKSSQFVAFGRTINKQIAAASNLSLRNYGEEDIASGIGEGGVAFSLALILAEIKDIQTHYQRPIETVFHLLGKDQTTFTWPIPEQFKTEEEETNVRTESESKSTSRSKPKSKSKRRRKSTSK